MTYRNVFDAAVKLVAEGTAGADISDYEDRATYILGTFYTENIPLAKKLDLAEGRTGIPYPAHLCVALTDSFPMSDTLLSAATFYLASMLVIDENEEMSDRFFDLYTEKILEIRAGLPAMNEKISDRYGEPV